MIELLEEREANLNICNEGALSSLAVSKCALSYDCMLPVSSNLESELRLEYTASYC